MYISFASYPSALSLVGILLDLLAVMFMSKNMGSRNLTVFLGLLILHVSVSIIYYQYTVDYTADAPLYYFDRGHLSKLPFQFGTIFLVRFTLFLRSMIGGTYFDYFLLFQAFGFWGIIFLARTFEEIHERLGVDPTPAITALLFFPGLHFWTSALGKDAPIFFATSLATWSALQLRTRILPLAIALVIMVLIRAHVALITVMALAFAALLHSRGNPLAKFGTLAAALAAAIFIAPTVQSSFAVDLTSANGVSDFLASKQQIGVSMAGQTTAVSGSFPVRLFSLLFRPMFFDANGIFGLVASVENIFSIAMLIFLVRNWREGRLLTRSVFFVRFALAYWFLLCILLAMVDYNVGLGLREKTMFMPAFFSFFVAQWAWQRRLKMLRPGSIPIQQGLATAAMTPAQRIAGRHAPRAEEAPR